MGVDTALISAIRSGLAQHADPVKAPAMQAYMKSEMPFRGVAKPERSALMKEILAARTLPDRASFSATVRALWREACYREERYAAIDLSGHRAYRRWQDPDLLALYDELIVTGAWWDYVDEIAIRRVGPILRAHRAELTPALLRWATGADPWRRRVALICQVSGKDDVDRTLLTAAIEASETEPDFFLRKGIGWALRDHAKTDPAWVRAFVRDHPRLSALSTREALKNLS
ncbi:MAG TPA: DNA alkylation repair protein [Amycolatopsis sp.]|jgi:3-methyladenine DNA glycosylase AlkD|nr:DNA alkylation repair protein [Amycolatopsis sp.]